ncbi:MAG: hypothetical protein V1866_03135 [archaeon]
MGRLRKRAEMSSFLYFIILEVIVFGMFAYAVTTKVNSAVKDTTFVRRVYSRDLALLIDSLHSANGEFIVNYELDRPLDFAITPQRVIFFDHSDINVNKRPFSAFLFGSNGYVNVTPTWMNESRLVYFLVSSNNTISLPAEVNRDNPSNQDYEPRENLDGTITLVAKEMVDK